MRHSPFWWLNAREFQEAPSDHRPALDGVRGIAILAVFLYDCLKLPEGGPVHYVLRKVSSAGWVGVDLFFVLSGFLITGILLDSRGKAGYFSSFFARRSLRIFPLYFLALWITFILVPQVSEVLPGAVPVAANIEVLAKHQVWFWTYLQNWWMALQGHWPDVNYLNHFWSLAVEEQFYLLWPFLVCWLGRRGLTRLCWGCVVAALALRVGLWIGHAPSVVLYVTTITRMDSLCLGALFAIGLRSPTWYPRLVRGVLPGMAGLAIAIVGVDAIWPLLKTQTAGAQTIGHTLLGFLFGAFVFSAAAVRPFHAGARVLSQPWLTMPGQFSYAMYVMHRPVHRLVMKFDWSMVPTTVQPFAIFAATLGASLACAALSWKFFEKPFLSLKAWFPRPGERSTASPCGRNTSDELAATTC
jgi:peptidoglycan/LPS O-acetylase OafA/YrhL